MNKINVVICGDVDGGKSTLTGRIIKNYEKLKNWHDCDFKKNLYEITDTLSQEKTHNKTILSSQFQIGEHIITNTPGHEEYIVDTISCLSTADKAIIVIAEQHGFTRLTNIYINLCKLFNIKNIILLYNKRSEFNRNDCHYNINLLNDNMDNFFKNLFVVDDKYKEYNLRFNSVFLANYTDKKYVIDENGNVATYSNIEKIDGIFYKSINPLNIGKKFAFYDINNKLIGFGIDNTRR